MTDTISGTNQRSASISPKKAISSEKQHSSKSVESVYGSYKNFG